MVLFYSELHTIKDFGTHDVFKIKDNLQLYKACKIKTPKNILFGEMFYHWTFYSVWAQWLESWHVTNNLS